MNFTDGPLLIEASYDARRQHYTLKVSEEGREVYCSSTDPKLQASSRAHFKGGLSLNELEAQLIVLNIQIPGGLLHSLRELAR